MKKKLIIKDIKPMPKRIYQIGEPCDVCGVPTVAGKDGNGYCKPCYIKWKKVQYAYSY